MLLRRLKELQKYTNNIEILKLVIDLNDEILDVDKLYKRLKKNYSHDDYNAAADAIAIAYIKEGIINNNKLFKSFIVYNDEFSKILITYETGDAPEFKEILDDYIDITKSIQGMEKRINNKDNKFILDVLLNDEYCENGVENHIATLNIILENINNNDKYMNDFLKKLVIQKRHNKWIKKWISIYCNREFVSQRLMIDRLIQASETQEISSCDLDEAISRISKISGHEKITLVIDALKTPEWLGKIEFKSISKLIDVIIENHYYETDIFSKFYLLKSRADDEIIEMMAIVHKNPNLADFIYDQALVLHLYWEEQKNLVDRYSLQYPENLEIFNKTCKPILEKVEEDDHIRATLHKKLVEALDKHEFATTIGEYISFVTDYKIFIDTISKRFKNNDNITSETLVKVPRNNEE